VGQAKRKRTMGGRSDGATPSYPAPKNTVPDDLVDLITAFAKGRVIFRAVKDGPIVNLKSQVTDRWDVPVFDMSDKEAHQILLNEMPDDEIFFEQVTKPEFPFIAVLRPTAFGNRSLFVQFLETDDGAVRAFTYIKMTHWQMGMLSYRFIWNSREMEITNVEQAANPDSEIEAAIQIYQLYQSCLWLKAREVPTEYVMSETQKRSSAIRVANGFSAISPVRVLSLSAVQKIFIRTNDEAGDGSGSPKSPHNRVGHQRVWKGRIINVKPAKIHGGAQGPLITKVVP
jgi:hypothetical protein